MQVTYNVANVQHCNLLETLVKIQQCATVDDMLLYADALLDELNGMFEEDMAACGLAINSSGDVVYTADMTDVRAQECTGRSWAHIVYEMLEDGDDADFVTLQRYATLAVVQRDMFVQGTL